MSSNTPTAEATVYHQGGATGVTFSDHETGQPDFEIGPLEGLKGSGRLSVGPDGQTKHESFETKRTNVGQEFNAMRDQATGILDTARSPSGGRAGNLNGQTVVVIDGMETNLATAEALGYVRRDAQGNYVETSQGKPSVDAHQAPQQGEQQQAPQVEAIGGDFMEPLPPAALEEVNGLIADIPQTMYDNTLNHVLVNGVESVNARELARVMGVDEATARARVAYVANLYKMTASLAIKGIASESSEDALTWAATERPKDFQNAMRRFVFGGETKALKELAGQYMKSTNPEDSLLRQAGFEVRTEKDGTRMVRINGVWTSVRAAVKQGII